MAHSSPKYALAVVAGLVDSDHSDFLVIPTLALLAVSFWTGNVAKFFRD